jgi:hypothetical protein
LGISIEHIKEGCCKQINNYNILVTDENRVNKNIKFVDYILDLEDKYLLIEEKSFILGILAPRNGKISDEVIEKFKNLTSVEKDLEICKTCFRLISDSNKKLKDTILYISKEFQDLEKIEKSPFIYLYCKSGLRAVDGLLMSFLSMKNRKNIFVSCSELEKFIEKVKKI